MILEKTLQLVSADAGQVLLLNRERTSLQRVAEITVTGERVGVMNFVAAVEDGDSAQSTTYELSQVTSYSILVHCLQVLECIDEILWI